MPLNFRPYGRKITLTVADCLVILPPPQIGEDNVLTSVFVMSVIHSFIVLCEQGSTVINCTVQKRMY